MALLQNDKAIFYHPCDDSTESLKSQAWTESTPTYAAGKVSNALLPTAGDPLAFGAEAEFLTGTSSQFAIAVLSATAFVACYRDGADSNHGTAKVGTVSGTDITYGAETEYGAGNSSQTGAVAISSTKFVVTYYDGGDGGHGTAKVGTVTGTSIAFGTEADFTTSTGANTSVTALSGTKVVVCYPDAADSSHGTAKVGTVTGTSIAFGAETEFLSATGASNIFAATLSLTEFVVAYSDGADSGHGTAKVGTVSGTDITFGAETEFNSAGSTFNTSVSILSATTFVVVYRDAADSGHGTAKVGTVSGTDITFGAEAEFLGADISSPTSAKLDASSFFVSYNDVADGGKGKAKVGAVSGTDITFGAATEFLTSGSGQARAAQLDTSKAVVVYSDTADSARGKAKIASPTSIGASLTASTPAAYATAAAGTKVAFVGWLKNPSA